MIRKTQDMIQGSEGELFLAEIKFTWTNGRKQETAVFPVPEGSRDVVTDLEEGVTTTIVISWRTAEDKLVREIIHLPHGAKTVREECVYHKKETETSSVEMEGYPGETSRQVSRIVTEGASGETNTKRGISSIASSWGCDKPLKGNGPNRCDEVGIPLINLGPLLRTKLRKLGEGAFGKVYAVERVNGPTLCVKHFRSRGGCLYDEALTLFEL